MLQTSLAIQSPTQLQQLIIMLDCVNKVYKEVDMATVLSMQTLGIVSL